MRNADSHFSVNPTSLDIGRSRFPRPFNHKLTMDFGDLVPFYWSEIYPGDTVTMVTSKVVRMTTPLTPVLDNAWLDTYYFFVPMRLVWEHTREFFGENTSGAWAPSTTYTIPQITTNTTQQVTLQSVADYMGVPVGVSGLSFSALPIRAYCRVYDDWFRDQTVLAPPAIPVNDSTTTFSTSVTYRGGTPYKAMKLHDYLTSCLPQPQRGSSVLIPFSGSGTVSISGTFPVNAAATPHSMGNPFILSASSTPYFPMISTGGINNEYDLAATDQSSAPSGFNKTTYSNLVTSVSGSGTVSGISSTTSVNDLRLAFAMQKFYEKSAMYGGRYVEFLKANFGVTSPDARLQRTEYLGGNRIPIQIHQVENTTVTTSSGPLGKLGAFSQTTDSNEDFTHSFVEHGFLIGVCCARYKHSYPQALERAWSRKTMFDYYMPLMANIGNQPVYNSEIFAQGTTADSQVFGYQEAWADLRYHNDRCSGYMRPGVTGSLDSWHYADYYTTLPTLSGNWMKEDKTNVDRTLTVASSAAPQLFGDFYCDATFVRAMPLYSIPGLIDHH